MVSRSSAQISVTLWSHCPAVVLRLPLRTISSAISVSRVCLFGTWWYSALGCTPSSPASRRIVSDGKPYSSSTSMARSMTSLRWLRTVPLPVDESSHPPYHEHRSGERCSGRYYRETRCPPLSRTSPSGSRRGHPPPPTTLSQCSAPRTHSCCPSSPQPEH